MEKNPLSFREVLPAAAVEQLLGRRDEDALILAFARWAEAKLRRWIDFQNGALLFLTVPDDPESGAVHLFNRATGSFWLVEVDDDCRWGGYREDEFDQFIARYGLKEIARRPRQLPAVAAAAA